MQLESLRYFLEVLKVGSITKAANNIFISQQGLSKSIQSLEKELHVKLLTRNASGRTVPTEAGLELSTTALELFGILDHMKHRMAHYDENGSLFKEVGTIRILTTMYFARKFSFVFDKQEFHDIMPHEIIIREMSFGKIKRELLESSENTVALVNVSPGVVQELEEQGIFAFDPVLYMDLLLKCSPGFFGAKRKSISAEEIRELPLALYNEPMLSVVLEEFLGSESDLNIFMHTTNYKEIGNAVSRGEAVTFTDTLSESAFGRGPIEDVSSKEFECIPIEGKNTFMAGFLSTIGTERTSDCLRYEAFCKDYINMKYDLYIKKHHI